MSRAIIVLAAILVFNTHAFGHDRYLIPCSEANQQTAELALLESDRMLTQAISKLESSDFEASKYAIKWLGVVNDDEVQDAADRLRKIQNWIEAVKFLCLIESSEIAVYAQVVPDEYFIIQLGAEFFVANEEGFDSRAGILVHELSHFVLTGATNFGTEREFNGINEALQLVKDDPEKAKENADNYQYLSESLYWNIDTN